MRAITPFLGVLLTAGLLFAQGEFSGPVLMVNPDARLVGTGGAGVALADDISALYINPAGLGFQHNGQFAAHYSRMLPTLYDRFNYLSIAWKGPVRGAGTYGVALYHYSMGGGDIMSNTGQVLGSYNSSETVLSISHGRCFSRRLGLAGGISTKMLYSNLASGGFAEGVTGDGNAFAFMIDLAMLWQTPAGSLLEPLDFGLTLANIGTRLDYSDGEHRDPLPLTLRLGLAMELELMQDHALGFMLDVERIMTRIEQDGDADMALAGFFRSFGDEEFMQQINMKLGSEYAFRQLFFGRAGINVKPLAERASFTLGFGILFNNIKFDFADEIGELDNSLRLSVAYLM
jgi:hypothetical protein